MSYAKTRSKGKLRITQEEYSSQMTHKGVSDVSQEEPLTFDTTQKYFNVKFSEFAGCMVTKDYIDRFSVKIDKQENRNTELESKVISIRPQVWLILSGDSPVLKVVCY